MSSVYLLCFDRPFHHARHYIGLSCDNDPLPRVALHRAGRSRVKLMRAVVRAGIPFTLTRVWYGAGRTFERKLKDAHFAKKGVGRASICPRCAGESAWGIAVWRRGADNRSKDGRAGAMVLAMCEGAKVDPATLVAVGRGAMQHLEGWAAT